MIVKKMNGLLSLKVRRGQIRDILLRAKQKKEQKK